MAFLVEIRRLQACGYYLELDRLRQDIPLFLLLHHSGCRIAAVLPTVAHGLHADGRTIEIRVERAPA